MALGNDIPAKLKLILAIQDWTKSISVRRQTEALLLDFSKAFDSVPHQRLLTKLNYYGIRGGMITWISAFFVKSFSNSLHKWCSLLSQACPFRSSAGLNPRPCIILVVYK